jgi:hypothetical protein
MFHLRYLKLSEFLEIVGGATVLTVYEPTHLLSAGRGQP